MTFLLTALLSISSAHADSPKTLHECKTVQVADASFFGSHLDSENVNALVVSQSADGSYSIRLGDRSYAMKNAPIAGVPVENYEIEGASRSGKFFVSIGAERLPSGSGIVGRIHYEASPGSTQAFVAMAICESNEE